MLIWVMHISCGAYSYPELVLYTDERKEDRRIYIIIFHDTEITIDIHGI